MRKSLFVTLTFLLLAIPVSGQTTTNACPEISVVGPAAATRPGDTLLFKAVIVGLGDRPDVTYTWSISRGVIEEGQGTYQITVRSSLADNGQNITAKVFIKGLSDKCEDSAFETAGLAAIPACGLPLDDYGKIRWPDEQSRLDNLLVGILNYPKSKAFIYIRVGPGETVKNTETHVLKMLKHFKWHDRNFDLGRLIFAIEKSEEPRRTSFHLVPDGAKLPECNGPCTILEGKTISLKNRL